MSRFRTLTPDDERRKEDEITIDLERFESELNASIARLNSPSVTPPSVGTASMGSPPAPSLPTLTPPSALTAAPAVPVAATAPTAPGHATIATSGVSTPIRAAHADDTGYDLLSELRQAAEEKTVAVQSHEAERQARIDRTEKGMRRLFRYLIEFSGHLNKIQPALPQVFRPLPNIELSSLHWTESSVDYRTLGGTEISPLDTVTLRYTLSAGSIVRIERLPNHAPAYHEELKRVGLRYTVSEKRGSRGLVEQVDFLIERSINVVLLFKAHPDQETVSLEARNLNGLNRDTYRIAVDTIDSPMLDELGRHILGRPGKLFEHLTKG